MRMLGKIVNKHLKGILKLRVLEESLLIRYATINIASPQKELGTLLENIRDLAT